MTSMYHYPRLTSTWPAKGSIEIKDFSGERLAGIPIVFMKKGHVLSWKYIHDVAQMGVLEEGKLY